MQITPEIMPLIEKHFGIKLAKWQKEFLLSDKPMTVCGGRTNGKMLTRAIKAALIMGKDFEVKCPSSEHAKRLYSECLEFVKTLKVEENHGTN